MEYSIFAEQKLVLFWYFPREGMRQEFQFCLTIDWLFFAFFFFALIVLFLLVPVVVGRAIWTKHVRNGKELPEIGRDNNYDFNFQVWLCSFKICKGVCLMQWNMSSFLSPWDCPKNTKERYDMLIVMDLLILHFALQDIQVFRKEINIQPVSSSSFGYCSIWSLSLSMLLDYDCPLCSISDALILRHSFPSFTEIYAESFPSQRLLIDPMSLSASFLKSGKLNFSYFHPEKGF